MPARQFEGRSGSHLRVPENLEHVAIERFHGFVIARQDLLLDGGEVQGVGDLLVIIRVSKTGMDAFQKLRKSTVGKEGLL